MVRPGDTLWSIATRFAPSTDPRVVVDAIASANGVDPGALVPGQQLSIPSVELADRADAFDHPTSWGYRARGHHILWPQTT